MNSLSNPINACDSCFSLQSPKTHYIPNKYPKPTTAALTPIHPILALASAALDDLAVSDADVAVPVELAVVPDAEPEAEVELLSGPRTPP
jgi:hypothetical protein